MRAASLQPSSYLDSRESIRSRAVSMLLALAITALIVLLMIQMGLLPVSRPPAPSSLVVMNFPGAGSQASSAPKAVKAQKAPRAPPTGPRPVPTKVASKPAKTAKSPSTSVPWNVIPMTSAEFASTDISTKPTHHEDHQTATADDSGGGPIGDRIVYAQLLRAPTDAELSAYRPRIMRDGWGEIQCRLNEHRRLEDCKEIGETPGSGYSRMMRQAAWEFVIAPTRVNGKEVVGMTVRVRYDFTGYDDSKPAAE